MTPSVKSADRRVGLHRSYGRLEKCWLAAHCLTYAYEPAPGAGCAAGVLCSHEASARVMATLSQMPDAPSSNSRAAVYFASRLASASHTGRRSRSLRCVPGRACPLRRCQYRLKSKGAWATRDASSFGFALRISTSSVLPSLAGLSFRAYGICLDYRLSPSLLRRRAHRRSISPFRS